MDTMTLSDRERLSPSGRSAPCAQPRTPHGDPIAKLRPARFVRKLWSFRLSLKLEISYPMLVMRVSRQAKTGDRINVECSRGPLVLYRPLIAIGLARTVDGCRQGTLPGTATRCTAPRNRVSYNPLLRGA